MALQSVTVTTILNTTYYVPLDEFSFSVQNIPETPDSVIGNYIRGSRKPMLKANTNATFTGTWVYLNPIQIVSMTPTYA